MSNFHDFLVKHALFPFPVSVQTESINTTSLSQVEIGMLDANWKAKRAVRDDTLVDKLCTTLRDILGNQELSAASKDHLLNFFSPRLGVNLDSEIEAEWRVNAHEAQTRSFLNSGFLVAARKTLFKHSHLEFKTDKEDKVDGGVSKVDYVALVDTRKTLLLEAKSPTVMMNFGELLPVHGFECEWNVKSSSLVRKILEKSALCLGLRHMEWLFISSHNHWVVCRLMNDEKNPFLAYSPMLSIEDSSQPFRAFLGAILSIINGVPVSPSTFDPDHILDIITEEQEQDAGPPSENDLNDGSGTYHGSTKGTGKRSFLDRFIKRFRKRTRDKGNESGLLMITSSSKKSPETSQLWINLCTFHNNTFALPQYCESRKPRVWLTHFVGSGSTGNVWRCCFDDREESFAIKIVETLQPSEEASRERLRNEFKVYLALEEAYQSGKLLNRIAPQCYGAFKDDAMDVLILALCDGVLGEWDELSDSERVQVYNLLVGLHRIGIAHGDLEPRNVARVHGGGLRLIDFSHSGNHLCNESKEASSPIPKQKCSELQTLRQLLWRKRPLRQL